MKREFLKDLKLEDEIIEKVMTEYGKSINGLNQELETLKENNETLQEQLTQRDTDLESLKDSAKLSDDQKRAFEELQTKYTTEKADWEQKFIENAKNASWEISIAQLGVIDPVALKAHTADFVKNAEFKDGEIIGFKEHAKELLKDKLSYLVQKDKRALGGELNNPPETNTVEKQIYEGFGIKENKGE